MSKLNAGIEELEKSLSVEQRRLSDYQRDLERMEEKIGGIPNARKFNGNREPSGLPIQ